MIVKQLTERTGSDALRFFVPICYVTGHTPLALPLGELPPQATEGGVQPSTLLPQLLTRNLKQAADVKHPPLDLYFSLSSFERAFAMKRSEFIMQRL